MSVGQFFLGLVTILVATVVYRWQKLVERETALQDKQRELFARYLTLTNEHFLSQPYKGAEYSKEELDEFFGISEAEIEFYSIRDELALISSDRIYDAINKHDEKFRAWKVSFPRETEKSTEVEQRAKFADAEYRNSRHELIGIMRLELVDHQSFRFPKRVRNWVATKFAN